MGYIRKEQGPVSSRLMFVPKKDRTKRIVINYRALNNKTINNVNKALH